MSKNEKFFARLDPRNKVMKILALLMVCIWRHGGHVGGKTQKNMLLVPLSDPAGVGGCHCLPHPERLIANQEYVRFKIFFSISSYQNTSLASNDFAKPYFLVYYKLYLHLKSTILSAN